jgi:hypothetical protein
MPNWLSNCNFSANKYDRVHFNYLDRDALLSTIYRALETNAKVYKLSGCAEPFSLNYYVHGK